MNIRSLEAEFHADRRAGRMTRRS